ncbi:amidohydrolase [Virgibacillus pantothenticus]|uniref:M20 family metallopeptidase n=1 Tax=Virgibacillus pantothenticus TaxID=1473 RepID=UPI001B2E8D5E|nr:M20 family metallopeptidase [Virgibacillus pantothenticus]MBU8568266.1 M20 family metallopeptidase [Virgibacillus pantothenticus]MBU8602272.1 M20 family metallopeptidase [Virgibacillus pantothenticus]MBU8636406.1 M20 family metallopeptidase [Virgibacillus pantothenticus]MBU8644178.1 M20 family metallopeptidase [Virgibacillus pantothenticus]MBU8648359.1 M20 family metallopeptidase [Virgibacillus pantothenticus]
MKTLKEELKYIHRDLCHISDHLYKHPELGDQEYQSMQLLMNLLKEHQFEIEAGVAGRKTAFKAVFDSGKPGPAIAYLAEYDALPGVGHGCGHNLIGTMSIGAGIILSKQLTEIGGSVLVLGTPAEETNGAKVPMSENGFFDSIDVAMIVHPGDQAYESGDSLAMDAIQFAYFGKTAHAAAAPEKGINALDSVLQLFNGINALREHLPTDVRIHGIIANGGEAANVIPDKAVAQFYVRAKERKALNAVVEKVKKIAEGAALMTGATLEVSNYELSYDNMVTNQALSNTFTKHLEQITAQPVLPAKQSYGSIDMGNVSHVVPAIHPYIGFDKPGLIAHTKEFADMTITDKGHQMIADGALALAQTGFEVITDPNLLTAIKQEFNQRKI